MGYVVGVDIGGTFTDCVAVSSDGEVTIGKSSSTPPDFDNGFLNAISVVAERNGRMLACVMVKLLEGDLYFGRLSVLPSARGQGLAKRLVEAVEDEARRRELPGVRCGVRIVLTENQRLFASLGYLEIGREAHEGFDHPTSLNLRKALR